jgi:arylsulfatase A
MMHVLVCVVLSFVICLVSSRKVHNNVLLILADDLGFGDTSVPPFIGLGVKTPFLEAMAKKGTVLSNYHTAAATCTPTRASILTGMYPWRLGIKAVFEYGERGDKGPSNRDDWLPPIPTIPMVLSEANYSVLHSGKWHLGGMRRDDVSLRQLDGGKPPGAPYARRCPHPGPNQQGFQDYMSMLDGPGEPRQNRLQIGKVLYSHGCEHMLHNDAAVTSKGNHSVNGFLSYCEAEHAVRAMKKSVLANQPFYIQVWFHCPHGPLEEIPGYRHLLPQVKRQALTMTDVYITMIADMDKQIGRLLATVEDLGIERETLVLFTSDNGPETFAGTTAGLKGNKRFLYEGGIRVPAIAQWVGTIPAGKTNDQFMVSTDLFPTFLDAAGVKAPPHLRLDGLSVLPMLVPDYYKRFGVDVVSVATAAAASSQEVAGTKSTSSSSSKTKKSKSTSSTTGNRIHSSSSSSSIDSLPEVLLSRASLVTPRHSADELRENEAAYRAAMQDRVTLWHNDYEGPRRTAAWVYDYKVIADEKDVLIEMYDMKNDRFEKNNLLLDYPKDYWRAYNFSTSAGHHVVVAVPPAPDFISTGKHAAIRTGAGAGAAPITLAMVKEDRGNKEVHFWVASHMYRVLRDFAVYGDRAHKQLLAVNRGWRYVPTLESDFRTVGKRLESIPHVPLDKMLSDNLCGTALFCENCDVKVASKVPSLPFNKAADNAIKYLNPGKMFDGYRLLKLKST